MGALPRPKQHRLTTCATTVFWWNTDNWMESHVLPTAHPAPAAYVDYGQSLMLLKWQSE